ncbi:MAG: tetratricopeptide repeat protein [Gammaproteobacteria bacterium]|nr:tetratricopeptide repeat protein [Gammaproteobacteria bacterium]
MVTATKTEARAVLETFSKAPDGDRTRRIIGNKTYYSLGVHGGAPVFMTQSEMGIATPGGSLPTIQQAIQDLRPQAVIMCGIAFGLRPDKQQLGDILIARQILYYEPGKTDTRQGRISRGDRAVASIRLLDRFRSGDNDWQGARTHFGLVLSGEKLVNDPDLRDSFLKTEPEAVGGEMEGAGLYAAASQTKTDWILVKAICDWADGDKNDEDQSSAARNAAEFVLHVLQLGGWEMPEQSKSSEPNTDKITQRKAGKPDIGTGQLRGGLLKYWLYGISALAVILLMTILLVTIFRVGDDIKVTVKNGDSIIAKDNAQIYVANHEGIPEETYNRLAEQHGVTKNAIKNLLKILGKNSVDPEDLNAVLHEVAKEHKRLQADIERIFADDAAPFKELHLKAKLAINEGDYKQAKILLINAEREITSLLTKKPGLLPNSSSFLLLQLKAAHTQAALGRLGHIQLKYDTAGEYFQEAANQTPKKNLEKYRLPLSEYLDLAGWMDFKRGRYPAAAEHLQKSLKFGKEHRAKSDPLLNRVYNHLAETYRETDQYEKAGELYLELLNGLELALGEASGETKKKLRLLLAEAHNNYGQLYAEENADYLKAEQHFKLALEIRKEILGEKAAKTAESLHNIAALYDLRGEYKKAAEKYEQALTIKRKALAPNHPSVAFTLHGLAGVYLEQARYKEAKEKYIESKEIKENVLGKQHKSLAATYDQMAQMYQEQKQYKQAAGHYQNALDIRKKSLGENHHDLLTGLGNFASLHYEQKEYAEAAELFGHAVRILQNTRGDKHPDTLSTLHKQALAMAYQATEHYNNARYTEAIPLYEDALDIYMECCNAAANDKFVRFVMGYHDAATQEMAVRISE